jgi:hypothetical protein
MYLFNIVEILFTCKKSENVAVSNSYLVCFDWSSVRFGIIEIPKLGCIESKLVSKETLFVTQRVFRNVGGLSYHRGLYGWLTRYVEIE